VEFVLKVLQLLEECCKMGLNIGFAWNEWRLSDWMSC